MKYQKNESKTACKTWAGEMAQWVKALAVSLSFIPENYVVEGDN